MTLYEIIGTSHNPQNIADAVGSVLNGIKDRHRTALGTFVLPVRFNEDNGLKRWIVPGSSKKNPKLSIRLATYPEVRDVNGPRGNFSLQIYGAESEKNTFPRIVLEADVYSPLKKCLPSDSRIFHSDGAESRRELKFSTFY